MSVRQIELEEWRAEVGTELIALVFSDPPSISLTAEQCQAFIFLHSSKDERYLNQLSYCASQGWDTFLLCAQSTHPGVARGFPCLRQNVIKWDLFQGSDRHYLDAIPSDVIAILVHVDTRIQAATFPRVATVNSQKRNANVERLQLLSPSDQRRLDKAKAKRERRKLMHLVRP